MITLQELYYGLLEVSVCEGSPLEETDIAPFTHKVFSALNLLEVYNCSSACLEWTVGDHELWQQTLNSAQAGAAYRRGLLDLDLDHRRCERSHGGPKHRSSIQSEPIWPKEIQIPA